MKNFNQFILGIVLAGLTSLSGYSQSAFAQEGIQDKIDQMRVMLRSASGNEPGLNVDELKALEVAIAKKKGDQPLMLLQGLRFYQAGLIEAKRIADEHAKNSRGFTTATKTNELSNLESRRDFALAGIEASNEAEAKLFVNAFQVAYRSPTAEEKKSYSYRNQTVKVVPDVNFRQALAFAKDALILQKIDGESGQKLIDRVNSFEVIGSAKDKFKSGNFYDLVNVDVRGVFFHATYIAAKTSLQAEAAERRASNEAQKRERDQTEIMAILQREAEANLGDEAKLAELSQLMASIQASYGSSYYSDDPFAGLEMHCNLESIDEVRAAVESLSKIRNLSDLAIRSIMQTVYARCSNGAPTYDSQSNRVEIRKIATDQIRKTIEPVQALIDWLAAPTPASSAARRLQSLQEPEQRKAQ